MLFLPLEADSLLFRVCLYYGVLVLLLELLVPLLFQRRVRVELPRMALRGPARPLSTREFQQRRLALQQQVEALQRATAETPRWSPQKRRQLSASGSKRRSAASPSPSPLTSSTSSVKVSRPESPRRTSEAKRRISRKSEQKEEELGQDDNGRRRREEAIRPDEGKPRQPPLAMGESLATRTTTGRQGGFSFYEAIQEDTEEKSGETQRSGWEQAMNMRTARRRASPTFSGRKPVRFVSESVGGTGYSGPSEAAARLEALIGARRRQRGNSAPMNEPLQRTVATVRNSPPAPILPSSAAETSERRIFNAFKPVQEDVPTAVGQREEVPIMEEVEETKESELGTLTDFQAFCASFAAGGSAAAQQATAKRKHHEAFGSKSDQTTAEATAAQREKYKHPRVAQEDDEQLNISASPAVAEPQIVQPNIAASPAAAPQRVQPNIAATPAAEPQRVETAKHYESFGSDDERAIDEALATQHVLDKRTHHQAFGTEDKAERPQEKTPRIVRRISFTDEVDALAASPPKETPKEPVSGRSTGKRKRQQRFGMIDEDDDDAEWRSSLAFQPHHFG